MKVLINAMFCFIGLMEDSSKMHFNLGLVKKFSLFTLGCFILEIDCTYSSSKIQFSLFNVQCMISIDLLLVV